MSDRKLASIQKILDIEQIVNSENILKASILGWECVVAKKDGFKVGDNVVYIEVDSILHEKALYLETMKRIFLSRWLVRNSC